MYSSIWCLHSNKLRIECTRQNRHARLSKKFDTQTCENDTFTCEIHMHACRFLNIFLLRHAHFAEHTPKCVFSTQECDFYSQSVILTRSSVTSIRRVRFSHAKCDSDMHECHFHIHKCDLDTHECD
jgi:hypothetical protein